MLVAPPGGQICNSWPQVKESEYAVPQKVATSFGSLINFNFREQDFFFFFLEIFLIALCTELTYALFLRRETVMAGSCPGRERWSKFSLNYLCGFRCCPVLQRFSIEQEFPSFHIPRLDDQLAFLVQNGPRWKMLALCWVGSRLQETMGWPLFLRSCGFRLKPVPGRGWSSY